MGNTCKDTPTALYMDLPIGNFMDAFRDSCVPAQLYVLMYPTRISLNAFPNEYDYIYM